MKNQTAFSKAQDAEKTQEKTPFVISFYEKLHESALSWSQKTNYKPFLISFINIIRNCYCDCFLVKSCSLPEAVVRSCSIKKHVLNNFTRKHLYWSLFIDKAAGRRPGTLLKRDFGIGLFLFIFWNTFWYEMVDVLLLLLVDIFLLLLLVVVQPY